MSWAPEEERESTELVVREARAIQGPPAGDKTRRRGLLQTIGAFLGLVRDYTIEDIHRLKEAGVQEVEARPRRAHAEADAKIAEAAERHAKSEELLAEARRKHAEAHKLEVEADAELMRAEGQRAKDLAEAFETLLDAVSRIKQNGGTVALDEKQLLELLNQGRAEQRALPED